MTLREGDARITRGDLKFRMGDNKELANDNFVDAIVLEGINPDSEVYNEEFFGPVFNLFKVDSSNEALDLANKSDYGLASTIFTEDLDKAHAAAKRLRETSLLTTPFRMCLGLATSWFSLIRLGIDFCHDVWQASTTQYNCSALLIKISI